MGSEWFFKMKKSTVRGIYRNAQLGHVPPAEAMVEMQQLVVEDDMTNEAANSTLEGRLDRLEDRMIEVLRKLDRK